MPERRKTIKVGGRKNLPRTPSGPPQAGVAVRSRRTGKKLDKDGAFEASQDPELIIEEPEYNETEQAYRSWLLRTIEDMRDIREQPHDEFNGMTYMQRYIENFKAGNSYRQARKNPEDTSIVTGTTREKKLAIINAVLNLVFDVSFRAFNEDNLEDQQLGEGMSDIVFQANQIEQWDEKKIYAYTELADQGDVFIEDLFVDEKRIDKKRIKIKDLTSEVFENFDPQKAVKIWYSGPRRRVIPGPQVYLGNIRQPIISLQPRIFTRQVISYGEAQAIYGHLPRWKYVPRNLKPHVDGAIEDRYGFNWRLEKMENEMVEVLCYQDKYQDEYQIVLNGVMQLPVGFPMPWEHGEYNIVQGHLEPISAFFAYSKSIPDKTFIDQQVLDEMYRLAVLKTQKSLLPPIANYSANILSKRMFMPGAVNNELEKGDIEVVGGNPSMYSMQQAEFEMIKMIKQFIDEKSVSPHVSGQAFGSRTTAVEVDSVMKQAKQQLGIMIFGFMNMHLQLDLLRLYICLENYTKEQGEKISDVTGKLERKFKAFSVQREIGGRGMGMKRVEFTESPMTSDQLYDMEEGVKRDESGAPLSVIPPKKPVRVIQIKPSTLRQIKYRWYPQIQVNERESSLADRISFEDRIMKAKQLWGPGAVNDEFAKQQWAVKNDINPQFFFTQGQLPVQPQEVIDQMEESTVNKISRQQPTGVQAAARQGAGVV